MPTAKRNGPPCWWAIAAATAELVVTQFEGCRPEWCNRVWGLFGENDTVAHYEPLFQEHYPTVYHFPGAHAPTPEEVKKWYAPLAMEMLKSIEQE